MIYIIVFVFLLFFHFGAGPGTQLRCATRSPDALPLNSLGPSALYPRCARLSDGQHSFHVRLARFTRFFFVFFGEWGPLRQYRVK